MIIVLYFKGFNLLSIINKGKTNGSIILHIVLPISMTMAALTF